MEKEQKKEKVDPLGTTTSPGNESAGYRKTKCFLKKGDGAKSASGRLVGKSQ